MSEQEFLLHRKIEDVYPKLSMEKVKEFLQDHDPNLQKKITGNSLGALPEEITGLLHQVYIAHSLNSVAAIKARFFQFLEISEKYEEYMIMKKNVKFGSVKIDLILKHKNQDQHIWVFFYEHLDRLNFSRLQTNLSSIQKKEERIPDEIFFVCGKLERLLGIEKNSIQLERDNLPISFLVEYNDFTRPFDMSDLIFIDDLQIYGFNFGSIDEVIDLLKKHKGPGQYSIKIETPQKEEKIIWEGILFPKQILKN